MQELNSSHLHFVHYEPETKKLQIAFRKGETVYEYSDVPGDVYQGLIEADSASEYFRRMIKGQYKFERLN